MNNIDNFIQIFSSGNSDVSVHTLGISVIKSNYYYYPENYLSNIITKYIIKKIISFFIKKGWTQ